MSRYPSYTALPLDFDQHPHSAMIPGRVTSPLPRFREDHKPRAYYEELLTSPIAKYLLFNSALQVLTRDGALPRWFSAAEACKLTREHDSGRRALPRLHVATGAGGVFCAFHLRDARGLDGFANVRDLTAALPKVAAVAQRARSLFAFHASHRFCAACGSATAAEAAGARRRCVSLSCGALWRPRIDVVVVVLLVDRAGARALLTRKRHYPAGEFRCISGTVEHAEGVDDAVRRRVFETLGISVGSVRWLRSQPWPYPHCLMMGCVARADEDTLVIDSTFVEIAKWFSRDQLDCISTSPANESSQDCDPHREGDTPITLPDVPSIVGELVRAFVEGHSVCRFDD